MMQNNDLIGFGLFIGYFIVAGLPLILLKANHKTPFEVARKMYHFVIVLSIFPLLNLFSTWYVAVLAALAFLVHRVSGSRAGGTLRLIQAIAVERECGEFKRSLVIVQLSLALLITIFWGLLGIDWQYVAVVAVMAWGFGDAAAALVGKKFGRRKIQHPRVEGAKTVEGTLAMYRCGRTVDLPYAPDLCRPALVCELRRRGARRAGVLCRRTVLSPRHGYAHRAALGGLRDPAADVALLLAGV